MFRDISSIKDLINAHESENVEFKLSFRWNRYTEKIDKSIAIKITRVTSSFLNTNGGLLFIGIEDDGKIVGVKKDIETYNNNDAQKGKDLFLTDVGEKIRKNIGVSANSLCKLSFKTIDSKEILIIDIEKSKQPYFHQQNEFYVRSQNATTKLSKEETYDYFKYNNIELTKKNLEYLFFSLLGYLRLLKNVIIEKVGFYFALLILSVSYYFVWYVNLFIDYVSSVRLFSFQFVLINLFLLGLTVDISRIYRNLNKTEKTTKKTFKNYIPQVNKRIIIVLAISLAVSSVLSLISFLIVFSFVSSNLIEAIIYFSQYILILTYFIILSRNIRKFSEFSTNLLDEKDFLD